jgi:NAD(P)-dependent dehydrogenase (short-subunit alcohol dehydrogenase family)
MKIGTSERADLPIALIIGGGGMGMATARRLGQSYRLVLASLSASKNKERQRALAEDGIDATCFDCDVTDPAAVAALADFVASRGPLRALAHVAANSPSMAGWREILILNLVGAAHIERAMLPLVGQGTAAVFVSSLAPHLASEQSPDVLGILEDPLAPDFIERLEATVADPDPGLAYTLSKLALNRMCVRRAVPWGRRGGRIVSMSPGLIATPMGALEFSSGNREAKIGLLHKSAIRREGTMVETSDAIEFLLSDKASFITGTDLLVDGGALAAIRGSEEY